MMRNFKILVSILFILIVVYFMNTNSQNQLLSKSDQAIIIDKQQIKKILIQQDGDALELVKHDTLWTISGNDTLIIKSRSIDDFFNKVLEIKKETIISENPEKYATYSIDDSTGTHLALIDSLDQIGFLQPLHKRRSMIANIRSMFHKMNLSNKEMRILLGIFASLKNRKGQNLENVKLLKKYLSESGRILPSRVTSVSLKKQRELSKSIKRARLLALI